MTQAVGHRGPQPPNYVSSFARPKAGSKLATRPQPKANANGVKFGGMGQALMNGSVNTFQNITEVFLAGFLAQDVFAMWMPRVKTALQEGQETYDPTQDPEMKDKPFKEQARAWVTGNVQGLNWINFFEATKREFATGPGLLAVPALAFMINRALANPAIELSHASLKGIGEGLPEHLKETSAQFKNKNEFSKVVKGYLENTFTDINHVADKGLEGADSKVSKQAKGEAGKIREIVKQWIDTEVDGSVKHAELSGRKRFVENFKRTFGKGNVNENLPTLREKVETEIWNFNRKYRINEYKEMQGLIQDKAPLNNTAKTWHSYRLDKIKAALAEKTEAVVAEAKKGLRQTEFANIRNDVTRVGGFINKAWEKYEAGNKSNIAKATDDAMKSLITRKWAFGTGVTLLTAAYLVKLAFWAQNHGTYQATRLLNDDASKSKDKKGSEGSRNATTNAVQTQAGLPFGSQPAFSRLGQNFANRPQSSLSGNGFIHPVLNQSTLSQSTFNTPALNQFSLFQGRRAEGGQA